MSKPTKNHYRVLGIDVRKRLSPAERKAVMPYLRALAPSFVSEPCKEDTHEVCYTDYPQGKCLCYCHSIDGNK